MSVGTICTRVVATALPGESVRDVAGRMEERNVGTLVVVDPERTPRGILTDRDLVVRCLSRGLDPDLTRVEDVMTRPARSVDEFTPIQEAVAAMDRHGVRRLIVTGEGGALTGLLSVDDVILLVATEAARIGGVLARDAPILTGRPG